MSDPTSITDLIKAQLDGEQGDEAQVAMLRQVIAQQIRGAFALFRVVAGNGAAAVSGPGQHMITRDYG